MREKGQFQADGIWGCLFLEPLVTVGGDVLPMDTSPKGREAKADLFQILTRLRSWTAPFLSPGSLPARNGPEPRKGSCSRLLSGKRYTPIHFGFDISGPRFHLGFRIESPNDALESLFF